MSILGNNLLAQYYAQQEALPNEYKRVEYLEATGSQYILTQVVGNVLIIGDGQFTAITSQSQTFITSTSSGYAGTFFGGFTNGYWGLGLNDGKSSVSMLTKAHFVLSFDSSGARGTVNNEPIERNASYSQNSWSIFATNQGGYKSLARLWNIKISQQNKLVRNFIPCVRKSDGNPGLYDLCKSICPLTGTPFYINAGTGEFVTP